MVVRKTKIKISKERKVRSPLASTKGVHAHHEPVGHDPIRDGGTDVEEAEQAEERGEAGALTAGSDQQVKGAHVVMEKHLLTKKLQCLSFLKLLLFRFSYCEMQ